MQERLFDFLSATFGVSVAVAVVIIAVAFWLVYYITKKTTIINSDHNALKDCIKKTEIHIDEIRKDIAYLKGFTESMQKLITDGYTQKHSPISLTEKGKEEVKTSRLYNIIEQNWDTIFRKLENEVKSMNPYDIQKYCMENVFVNLNDFFCQRDVSYIKELAYKKGLALMTYTNMLAVLIRDKYFLIKGIAVEDVDKYDPNR